MTVTETSEELMRLYEALRLRKAKRPTVREMSREDRLAYHAEANRRSRAKTREATEKGCPEPSVATIRDALADAALIILAAGAPGAEQVERLLGLAFTGRAGVPGTVRAKARSGSLRPKVLTPDKLRMSA
jgi:hypothetical protein